MTKATLPRFHDRLTIGDGLAVSPFCLGLVKRPEAVLDAFDAGINFFFVSADLHWPYYEPSRRGLEMLLARGSGMRERIVVAGVSYMVQPEFSAVPYQELVESVAGLGTLDVLIAGGVLAPDVPRRIPELHKHRAKRWQGARAIGATFHDRSALVPFAQSGELDLCLVRYNAAHRGAETEVFPHVTARKAPIFNFKTAMGHVSDDRCDQLGLDPDFWRPRIPDHYRYVLSQDAIDGVLCSLDTPEHLEELAAALEEGPMSPEERDHLAALKVLDQRT